MVNNLPATARVRSVGQEGPLEEGVATRSSVLAWRIQFQGQRSPADYSPRGHRELDMTQ